MVSRLIPYWESTIVSDLEAGKVVLIAAHGNSLRALCKHLDAISDDDIVDLNIPTGDPLVYDLDPEMRPLDDIPVLERSLDPVAARKAAEAVARQAS